jgi:diaminopimelate epimerase
MDLAAGCHYIAAMIGRFSKMHGLGNDFVIIDGRSSAVPMSASRARAISDRHLGIGCDQLILLEESTRADVRMRIFNADGGEVAACGNATRCVPLYLQRDCRIETAAGVLDARLTEDGASVDMGRPQFLWDQIPLTYAMDTRPMPASWEDLPLPYAVNVGNPHAIFFCADLEALELERLGPLIETDPLFPERVNVNFAQITGERAIRLIVWERGARLTQACGTGACATAVAAIANGLAEGPVTVVLPGGELQIAWSTGGSIQMTGPARHVFDGEVDWDRFG